MALVFHSQYDFLTESSISVFNTCATFFATLGVSVSQNFFTASIFSFIFSILNTQALSAVASISFPIRSFSRANLGQDCPIFHSNSLLTGFVSFHWEASICSAILLDILFGNTFFVIAHASFIGAVTHIFTGSYIISFAPIAVLFASHAVAFPILPFITSEPAVFSASAPRHTFFTH
jgi:hypothetical protein